MMDNGWKACPASGQPEAESQPAPDNNQVVVKFPDPEGCGQSLLNMGCGDPELTGSYGEPVYLGTDKSGARFVRSLNEAYWAAGYARDHVVLYEPEERAFYQYDDKNGRYAVVSPDAIKQVVSASMLEFSRQDEVPEGLEKLRTDRALTAVISQLRGIAERRGAFSDRMLSIHLANRMLWYLESLGLSEMPFMPLFLSRNQLPIAHVPGAGCPRFINELLLPAISPEDIPVLQKMAGQCLLGRNLVQRFLVFDGVAGGGKTQLANVIRGIVGAHNTAQLRTAHLGDRFETARFLGRTLLVGADVDSDFLSKKGAEVIKALVGGDLLDAEKKGGNGVFRFKGEFNVIITANARLKVRLQGDVGAWLRRMLVIRYEGEPPKRKIPNFAELLLREEGPGIVNWMIEGLEILLADIRETGDIRLPDKQVSRVNSLLAESDCLRIFLRDNLRISAGADLTVGEIISAYAQFCPEMGWDPLPELQIQKQLRDLMLEFFHVAQAHDCQRNGKAVRGYRNVALRCAP